ncbi:MAG: serine hydrolase [Pseudohongiella sp.]|nr:MAG: serine hydrolase [Pseudohongiella sp.]
MRNLLQFASVFFALVVATPTLFAQNDMKAKIDDIVQSTFSDDLPGVSVIVRKDGETLYRGAKGLANMELGIPIEPDMVFRIGSITKQFTAASILLLEERGLLRVEDTIDKHLDYYPADQASSITIDHLLAHTSGIVSYTGIPGYMMGDRIRRDLSTRELVDVFKDLNPVSSPGDEWAYNNSGYVLLGAIIEAVSGQSYDEFVQANIFDKLGMNNSHYGSDTKVIPRRVDGYEVADDSINNARFLSMSQPHAAGSLLSSVDDLAIWDDALFNGRVLSAESFEKMTRGGLLNNGEAHGYGYGFLISQDSDVKEVSHGGGIFGFATQGIHIVEEDLFVAVFSNGATRERNPASVAREIVQVVLQR